MCSVFTNMFMSEVKITNNTITFVGWSHVLPTLKLSLYRGVLHKSYTVGCYIFNQIIPFREDVQLVIPLQKSSLLM